MIIIVSENVSNIKTSKVAFFFYLKISTIVWVLAFYKRTVAVGLLKTYPEGAKCTCIGNTMSYIKWQHLCWQYIVHQKSRKKILFSLNFYILFKSPLFQHNALKDLFTYFNINSLLFKCDRIVMHQCHSILIYNFRNCFASTTLYKMCIKITITTTGEKKRKQFFEQQKKTIKI